MREFQEEEFGQAGDALVMVHYTRGHFTDLPLHFDHVIQDQVSQYLESVLPHCLGLVS
jgi:hypothetical protein